MEPVLSRGTQTADKHAVQYRAHNTIIRSWVGIELTTSRLTSTGSASYVIRLTFSLV